MNDEATRHNQAAYDKIAALYAQRQAMRGLSFPDLRVCAARLRILTTTEEPGSRHWLKILAASAPA